VSVLLNQLNAAQQKAVTAQKTNLRVVAGAGSGKTRVLTHRIAWLLSKGVSAQGILAVTFTNKAAYEMRSRIEKICRMPVSHLWVGTFHGLSHRLLRIHAKEANLPNDFQILDTGDQLRLIKRIHKQFNLSETNWPVKQAQWFINKQKEMGWRAKDVSESADPFVQMMKKLYHEYERLCLQNGLVDFPGLLLNAFELLKQQPSILHHYQNRFMHILIDEFQDTNQIQYDWIKIFKTDRNFIMAVGDDDQSIYSWRGACVENINRFDQDFLPVSTLRLEQNYRSTKTILHAANAVIASNQKRVPKVLRTDNVQGDPIILFAANDERHEAIFVVQQIKHLMEEKHDQYKDFAILYRSNAQSRIFEETLMREQIPYRIYGGIRFLERAEIKNALAYLRLLINRYDDAAFERIVNFPTRGIGAATTTRLRDTARDAQISLWQAAEKIVALQALPARTITALNRFLTLIELMASQAAGLPLVVQTELVLKLSGLMEYYKKESHTAVGVSKLENLEEFVTAVSQFEPADEIEKDQPFSALSAFLSHAVLEAGEMASNQNQQLNSVNLMTLHTTKGLEFPIVFLVGLEEGLFPHYLSKDNPAQLEEERRLCYVGITRAARLLCLTYSDTRYLNGRISYNTISRFVEEIPQSLLRDLRPRVSVSKTPVTNSVHTYVQKLDRKLSSEFHVGQRVRHKKFGAGVIIDGEGENEALRLQVKFERFGVKWLIPNFARLV
jgi:DNA helicase-2/ATP-dependent DNA helicase PcrA